MKNPINVAINDQITDIKKLPEYIKIKKSIGFTLAEAMLGKIKIQEMRYINKLLAISLISDQKNTNYQNFDSAIYTKAVLDRLEAMYEYLGKNNSSEKKHFSRERCKNYFIKILGIRIN